MWAKVPRLEPECLPLRVPEPYDLGFGAGVVSLLVLKPTLPWKVSMQASWECWVCDSVCPYAGRWTCALECYDEVGTWK